MILDAGRATWLAQLNVSVHLVAGDADPIVDLGFLAGLTDPSASPATARAGYGRGAHRHPSSAGQAESS